MTDEQFKDLLEGRLVGGLLDALATRIAKVLLKIILPRIEAIVKPQPRWLSVKSAGIYIDKTYEGMRYTLSQYPREFPIVMIGDKPRIDVQDIDRFMMNRKGK